MESPLRVRPVLRPSVPQLWSWASGNPAFLTKLHSLPESRREEALQLVYQASVKKYYERQHQVPSEQPPGSSQPLSDQSPPRSPTLSRSSRVRSRSRSPVRPKEKLNRLPSPNTNKSSPMTKGFSVLVPETISLGSFFQIEKLILVDLASTNGAGNWEPLAEKEDPRLVLLLAVVNMLFLEKTGRSFQAVDAAPILNYTIALTPAVIKEQEYLSQAQMRVATALRMAGESTTYSSLQQLADALHMGQFVLFRQDIFNDLLDTASLQQIYQQYRCKILTYYAQLSKRMAASS